MTLHPDLALRVGHERLHAFRERQHADRLALAFLRLPAFLALRTPRTDSSALRSTRCCPQGA